MEFREIKTFQAVASLLSFGKAAGVLNYAQSTVSAQIKSLENDLGHSLFIRRGINIKLTQAGNTLLRYAQKLSNLKKEIEAKLQDIKNPYGALTIKAPQSISTYFLPALFKDFRILFPNISIDIDWCTHYSLAQAFESDITDIAFLITDQYSEPVLQVYDLRPIPLVWVVHPAHELAKKKKFTLHDLRDQVLLLPKSDCSYELNIRKALLENQVEPQMKVELNSVEAIKQILLLGQGVTLIPEAAVTSEIKLKRLVPLKWQRPDFKVRLYLIWKQDNFIPPPLEAFIVAAKAMFSGIT